MQFQTGAISIFTTELTLENVFSEDDIQYNMCLLRLTPAFWTRGRDLRQHHCRRAEMMFRVGPRVQSAQTSFPRDVWAESFRCATPCFRVNLHSSIACRSLSRLRIVHLCLPRTFQQVIVSIGNGAYRRSLIFLRVEMVY